MSFEALHERLTALQETTSQLQELIDRLANLKFQPGSVPLGNDDENNVAAELSAEINQILREEEEDLELLQEEVTDLRSGRPGSEAEHNKARLKAGATRLDGELKSCRVTFRQAQLSARRSLEQAQRLERRLLLASYAASTASTPPNDRSGASSPTTSGGQQPPTSSSSPPQQQQLFPANYRRRMQKRDRASSRGDAAVTAAGSDVTAALRRTHDQIAAELSRSAFARQTLAESTAALNTLQGNYAGLEGLLASSRELAGTLLTSGKSDTWYLETAFMILAATLGWLVFRRWLYGPLWWVVWLPVRTVWRTGGAVSRIGGEGGAGGDVVMAPVGGGERTVMGGDEGAVPTMKVSGGENAESAEGGDPDSMVEKVGKIVKGEGTGDGDAGVDNSSGNEPNPKKRMWDENVEAKKDGRGKDEL